MSYSDTTFELTPEEHQQINTQEWRDLIPHMDTTELFSWNTKISQTLRIEIDWLVGLTLKAETADRLHNLRSAAFPIFLELFQRNINTHTQPKAGN